ncbi:hypothetical protein SNOG_03516 [Parastagonospora nodorum SN15]|uniref:Uncharacterized protein n=1 Tax=Phaeosphaeria nodorum (strain SN15 / ATCC MYA-4574 / FGSC 10173) TaxID=321614 RepID=Q0UXJ8_PHANO|nr:hypothetical protein SNOG_03516 [Parastagonospora nodorum SN15]EAT88721.1 hypothetical protein SNOG_03516 [Parastagonospora nodorum SN15]
MSTQTALHDDVPPPYTTTQSTSSQLQTQQLTSNTSCVQHTQPSSNESKKQSRWQRLKQDNQDRKAKKKHVTHEEAARMVGHDEDWLKERAMGKEGENGWVKKGSGGDGGYTIM